MTGRNVQSFSLPSGDTSQQAMVSMLSSSNSQSNKNANAYPDFFPAAQNDFAARLKWSVTPKYADANHEPVVTIEGPQNVFASPGQTIRLNGNVSDPDGNKVAIKWWQFMVGTYPNAVEISDANTQRAKVTIPKDAVAGQTIHIILEATDNGSPSLTRYQRIIIAVK